MSKQFQNNVNGMFGGIPGLFPNLDTISFLTPFLNLFIGTGVLVMFIGLGIFAYGQFQKRKVH
jgi:hypothetical protein